MLWFICAHLWLIATLSVAMSTSNTNVLRELLVMLGLAGYIGWGLCALASVTYTFYLEAKRDMQNW